MPEPVTTGKLKKLCHFFCRPSTRFSLLALLASGFIAGVVFWVGFNAALSASNTEAFCIGCHEMQQPYEEYKKTVHYANRTGVKVTCADCHVPKAFLPKMYRKFEAWHDVWGHWAGSIDTPEKFEANRKAMAEREWARMKASDSGTCRSCHSYASMDHELQDSMSVKKHSEAENADSRKTCIDCHQGIAHELPKEAGGEQED